MQIKTTIRVPADLIDNADLSPRARAVAVYLLGAADEAGRYYGGPEPLVSAGMGSARVVRKAMRELEGAGVLERSRLRGGRMLYQVTA